MHADRHACMHIYTHYPTLREYLLLFVSPVDTSLSKL